MTPFLTAPRPIRAILIANRGEIACRIIATCRRLGLRSIAVYSDADVSALHVKLADEAHRIGPAPAAQSYLSIANVIAAAKASGADAVHPGYGFLSENAAFASACAEAGLIFIGPAPEAVAAMGSKIEARRLAEAAGVPVVPGYEGKDQSPEAFAAAAQSIGYPVMVKAASGGGGRGMRRVERPEDLPEALASARAEAGSAFGDATVFLEKLILAPRHIEVQVFGDGAGGAVHFHERDCSVQRNHQKLIEEAPAPHLSEALRQHLFEAALRLTRAIRYGGAGTVEFILGTGSEAPYFLEMNTRLQVEHPVTEAICGVDLVEWQIRQAAGLPFALSQDQIAPKGHAIEVRLNAERPESGFLPATGTCLDLRPPRGLRLDTGVGPGSEVGSHYDSLLAKLIAWAPTRAAARLKLLDGVQDIALPGIATNQAFLGDCLAAPDFAEGRATTDFLTRTYPAGWQPDPERLLRLRGAAALANLSTGTGALQQGDGFRVTSGRGAAAGRIPLAVTDQYGTCELVLIMGAAPRVISGERDLPIGPERPQLWRSHETLIAHLGAMTLAMSIRPLAEARMGAGGTAGEETHLLAPLTGLVTELFVQPGDLVDKGQPLLVMEAMKLVHPLSAPRGGRVAKVACRTGETIAAKSLLIEIEEIL